VGRVESGRGSENFPNILKLVVHYVCNLYQTVRFVNLQSDAYLYYYIIYCILYY